MKLAIIFVSICGFAPVVFSQPVQPPSAVLGVTGGRYVFGQISTFRSDQYLLDTQTGRMWRPVCTVRNKDDVSKCESTAMEAVDFLDGSGKISGTTPPAK